MSFSSHLQKRRKAGFTLIELLVVVAIIALLISILFPALAKARAAARSITCLTHLREQAEAAMYYSHDNDGYIPRGIQGFETQYGQYDPYAVFPTAVLKYLGYDNGMQLTYIKANGTAGEVVWDGNPLKLWGIPDTPGIMERRDLNRLLRTVEVFQCPDFPDEVKDYDRDDISQVGENPWDYVVSAFTIPYTRGSMEADTDNDLMWNDGGMIGESGDDIYIEMSRVEDMPTTVNASDLIYLTEGHTSLPWSGNSGDSGVHFHTFFLASHLPFAGHRRIANDERHPGGINVCFFNGNARTMGLREMDPGWPTPRAPRLRWFTVVPAEFGEG